MIGTNTLAVSIALLIVSWSGAQPSAGAQTAATATTKTKDVKPLRPAPKPTLQRATLTLECSGKNYEISTGTNSGTCKAENGTAWCDDVTGKKANSVTASCAKGCESASGAGKCTVKSK